MVVDRSVIRVKAMIVAPNADGTAHAVTLNPPNTENPRGFHRLIGGSVELGERHRDAIVREVHEEVGAQIRDLAQLDVLENIFLIDGQRGHEIVFVYTGHLDPQPPAEGGLLLESDGSQMPIVWRPFTDDEDLPPLYPAGLQLDGVGRAKV